MLMASVIQGDLLSREKMAAAAPAISLGPKNQRCEKRRTADCGPRVIGLAEIRGEIKQQITLWGKITAPFVDSDLQPLAAFECVIVSVPTDEQHGLGRAAGEHVRGMRDVSHERVETH